VRLQRDPRVALCVDDEAPPFRFVLIQGTAELSPHDPAKLEWATRIARRYMGNDVAEAYGRRNAVEGELVVRLIPTKVIAQKGIAD